MTDDLQVGTATPVVADPVVVDDEAAAPGPVPVAEQPVDRGPAVLPVDDPMDWSWPPYAPLEPAGGRLFDCEDWAPSSIVRRPLLRVGRWTLLYRRGH